MMPDGPTDPCSGVAHRTDLLHRLLAPCERGAAPYLRQSQAATAPQFVLPDTHRPDAHRAQLAVGAAVACLVACELGMPVVAVVPRLAAVFRASVPEAPVG